jgi:hypothetical protein
MSAPDRSQQVVTVVNQHQDLFGSEEGRRQILAYVCAALNVTDGGDWGLLLKPGGKIPADIIVWRLTREHIDVLTDTAATWIPKGVIAPDWEWIEADRSQPSPGPTLAPSPTHGYDEAAVIPFTKLCVALLGQDAGRVGVNCARMQFDAVTLGYEVAIEKHLRELHAEVRR